MNGFALGGAAEGFNQFRQTDIQQQNSNTALQLGLGRLKIEQQAQQAAQQRFDQQRHDEIANQALKDLLGAVTTLRQQNVSEADIQKKFGPALQMLRDNAKLRGQDPTTAVDIPFNSTLSSSIPLDYSLLIDNASSEYGVPKEQLAAGLKQESGFNKNAYNAKSGAGGIAQFTPATAKSRGVDAYNPESAIPGMASYIADLKRRFGNDGLAWAAYNWGPGNVDRWLKNGADPKQVPKETQQYVQKILGKPIEAFTGQGGAGLLESGNQPQQTTEMSAQGQPRLTTDPAKLIRAYQIAPANMKPVILEMLKNAQKSQDPLEQAKIRESTARADYLKSRQMLGGVDETSDPGSVQGSSEISVPLSNQQVLQLRAAGFTPAQADFNAIQYAYGNQKAATGARGVVGATANNIIKARAAQFWIDKGVPPQQANAVVAQFGAMTHGAQTAGTLEARMTQALTKARNTAKIVTDISSQIPRTQFPSINALYLAAQKQGGASLPGRLKIAIETLASNYGASLGMGNSVLTDFQTKRAQDLLEIGYSHGQLTAAVDQILQELNREEMGTRQGIRNFIGSMTKEIAGGNESGGNVTDWTDYVGGKH